MSEINKKLKLQLGVSKRLLKEVASYEKEVLTQQVKVQKMKDDGKDPYDIRKQEEVLQESYMMVPDSKGRFETSIFELSNTLVRHPHIAQTLLYYYHSHTYIICTYVMM